MAKILYGVMGNTYGHVMRTLAIMSRMPEHEFYFIGGGRVPEAMHKAGYPVLEVPVLRTVHRAGKVSVPKVIGQIAGRIWDLPTQIKRVRGLIADWQPDFVITDREFFLPTACKTAGISCASIDHSHVMKACKYTVPLAQRYSWTLAMINDYLLFDFTRQNLIVSFFHPPIRNARLATHNQLLPPVLRPAVTQIQPSDSGHVLVYQTSSTFRPLLDALRSTRRTVIVYGFGGPGENGNPEDGRSGNLVFKSFDPQSILEDLASCTYAVVNGGHNLICEALYYKKPLYCFPIATLFEQFINAWHVKSLGYGDLGVLHDADPAHFANFEDRLPEYRSRLANVDVDGTARVVAAMQQLIERNLGTPRF